ncbi:abnormal cell migration protein 10 isoform X2 [Plodia interpunctella]|uniref:abnormal cell migration protein 10 isoform X2 n=1 Tax=Plodia interpunctella TaxID=58824 RepID=UPI0023678142|nr:abnormal cell migration protein 10 isoform X2 [Plodia interpunctella]XP_053623703.1 abnormal cell migration protein 10 isoform X2 [Plodia interpunctella]XP_053623704.1 abnormal cell migration protein 10 isoform X2 [Plodia interpunctella]
MALVEEAGAGAEDPEALLNEWLGELTVLTAGLNSSNEASTALRPLEIVAPRIDTYRFSMANLEETQDADLDAILGELCALDSEYDEEISRVSSGFPSGSKESSGGEGSQRQDCAKECAERAGSIARTDSPDNDSAFSDTVSMLSSESSASSNTSSKCKALKLNLHDTQKDASFQQKADKIKLALERMREANVKKLFIKAFSMDGSSKSLLVDEKMTCGYVARLLADKNHVTMEPKWAIVEHLPDLHMERVYEDHEMLVDNLMLWTRESKNKILFAERHDKIHLFQTPEKFLLTEDDRGWSSEHDEHSRQVIIEEFFGQSGGTVSTVPSISGHPVPPMEGPLYLKSDAKKGWKKYHFVLRPSGLYYSPKDKVKTLKELVCLATFDTNEVYLGLNWKKKYKSPTDFCFAIKHPRLQQPKSVKFIKFLCADDQRTLERWVTAMRIAKHGRQLLENHRSLIEELTQEDLDHLAHARSCSISSIPTKTNGSTAAGISSPAQSSSSNASVANSDISSGRHSRASSSSSSGCLSDGGTASESAFDCEFPMGTIKRKPSMKPNIPLTWMTRQLKEMAEKGGECEGEDEGGGDGGTLTRRPRTSRVDDSTLKRHHSIETTESSVYSGPTSSHHSSLSSPLRHEPPSYGHYESIPRDNLYRNSADNSSALYGYTTIYDKVQRPPEVPATEDLPLPPPPTEDIPDGMFSSTLSLDSLPPPPPPLDPIEDISGSQLSLPPPPPEHSVEPGSGRVQDIVSQLTAQQMEQAARAGQARTFPRQPSLDSVNSDNSRTSSLHSDKSIYGPQNVAYGACLAELQNKKLSTGSPSIQKKATEPIKERTGSIKKVIFVDDIPSCSDTKGKKKISFNLKEVPPPSPRKPPPPKRNESTRLSSPKKLADSNSNPPKEFLKDLQRVMRKKWQVAQKCKLEPATTPHEVLGFREYPLSEDYKETSVSMWVQEHYGGGVEDPFYENMYGREPQPRREEPKPIKKRPPPAPPRRSESTHLSTHPHPSAVHPTA